MVTYCSLSKDRLLTKVLIESSHKSSPKCFHNFVNTPEWADGLDIWSPTKLLKKSDISRRYLDFHEDLGLYLPKYEKLNSTATFISNKNHCISSKGTTNKNYFPERFRQLLKREENRLNTSSTDEQLSSSEDNQTTNIIQKSNSNKIRSPLRQIESHNSSRENQSNQNSESINRESFQCLLKEQLSNFFSREISNINSKRTVIRIPSVEIKHQNLPPRTISQADPTLIIERYAKLQQLLISPVPNQPTINNKLPDSRQSSDVLEELPTLGLTVTPLDFSSTKQLQNSSSDKTSQQDYSLTTHRPSTQPVLLPSSIRQNEGQQRILFKSNIETGFIAASGDFLLANKNLIEEQTQIIKKFHRHHRSSSKNTTQRGRTLQFLPQIAGKRIHVTFSNQRNS